MLLLIAIGAIAWEAIRRFAQPMPVAASTVMAVAAVGIVINSVTAMLFWAGRKGDLNIQGTTEVALTAHLVKPGVQDEDGLIARTYRDLHERFGADHATLQIERAQGAPPCVLAPAHVI